MKKDWLKFIGWPTKDTEHNPESEDIESFPQEEFVARLPGNKKLGGNFDSTSATWAFIEAWAEERLDKLRKKNDTMVNTDNMSWADRTLLLRGQIAELKILIKLPKKVIDEQKKLNNK